jgi:hypothetical protein
MEPIDEGLKVTSIRRGAELAARAHVPSKARPAASLVLLIVVGLLRFILTPPAASIELPAAGTC